MKHHNDNQVKAFIHEYIEDVAGDLQEMYDLSEREAQNFLNGSAFLSALERDPEFVVNYDTEYWAERIYTTRKKNIYQLS